MKHDPWDEREWQGKREDQVSFSELVAGICLGLLIVVGIGSLIHALQ